MTPGMSRKSYAVVDISVDDISAGIILVKAKSVRKHKQTSSVIASVSNSCQQEGDYVCIN